jgi:hypothetical protein
MPASIERILKDSVFRLIDALHTGASIGPAAAHLRRSYNAARAEDVFMTDKQARTLANLLTEANLRQSLSK